MEWMMYTLTVNPSQGDIAAMCDWVIEQSQYGYRVDHVTKMDDGSVNVFMRHRVKVVAK